MGLFDKMLGRKDSSDNIVLEPLNGGYVVKGTQSRAPGVNKVCVFFSVSEPVNEEPRVVKSLIDEYAVTGNLAPGAAILTAYEAIPGIDDYLSKQEMPEELNAFLMSRAMMKGLARSQAEMSKLAINSFQIDGVKGVLVQREI